MVSTSKRLFDVTVALLLLAASVPILAVVSTIIYFTMGRPVLFRQERLGLGRKPFTIFKFRTMSQDDSPKPLPDRDRLTPIGRWLRQTSLDELPQLFNVLRGDISLVGPRPMPVQYADFFKETEEARFSVLPGITGWAQLHGRNEAGWDDRFARDVWYVQNWCLRLDIAILIRTCKAVILRKGVVVDARSTMLNLDEERRYMVTHDQTTTVD